MQVCTSLQTDNHASTPPLSFLQAAQPTASKHWRQELELELLGIRVLLNGLKKQSHMLSLTDDTIKDVQKKTVDRMQAKYNSEHIMMYRTTRADWLFCESACNWRSRAINSACWRQFSVNSWWARHSSDNSRLPTNNSRNCEQCLVGWSRV